MPEKKPGLVGSSISGAIDLMYFPSAGRETKANGKPGERRCRESIEPVVERIKQCKIAHVFVTQCKRWSCDRRIYCDDLQLDDILRYTFPYPQYFIGIAGYNPLEIGASIQEAEIGIRQHGFRGIYVHPGSFGVTLNDRRMYPLFAKALDWQVPIMLDLRILEKQERTVRATEIDQVAGDFPELNFVVAQPPWTGEEMLHLADELPNLHFCFDSHGLRTPAARRVLSSTTGQSRCMWGSNGLLWKEALTETGHMEHAVASKLLRDNAVRLFDLEHLPQRVAKRFVEPEKAPLRIVAE